ARIGASRTGRSVRAAVRTFPNFGRALLCLATVGARPVRRDSGTRNAPMTKQATLPSTQRTTPAPLTRLRNEVDRLFDDFGIALPSSSIFAFPARSAELMPAMDMAETDAGYEL